MISRFKDQKKTHTIGCFLLFIVFIASAEHSLFSTAEPLERAWLNRDDGSEVRYITVRAAFSCKGHPVFPPRATFEEEVMNTFLLEDARNDRTLSRNFLSADIFIRWEHTDSHRVEVISQPLYFDTEKREWGLRPVRKGPLKACFVSSAPHPNTEEFMRRQGFAAVVTEDEEDEGSLHSEEGLISTLFENIHLYRQCFTKDKDLSKIIVQGIGIRMYSAYDACDGCLAELRDTRKELVDLFRKESRFPRISPMLTCDVLFHSYRPYTREAIDDDDPGMARYHLWLPRGNTRICIEAMDPFRPAPSDGPPTAFIRGRAGYHLQFQPSGEIGSWPMSFSCIILDRHGCTWQDATALRR